MRFVTTLFALGLAACGGPQRDATEVEAPTSETSSGEERAARASGERFDLEDFMLDEEAIADRDARQAENVMTCSEEGLTGESIRRSVRRQLNAFRACLESRAPEVDGRVTVQITIEPDGHAMGELVEARPELRAVGVCLAQAVGAAQFCHPNERVVVRYPFFLPY